MIKKIIIFVVAMILVAPCLLIFNANENVWINFVGLGWLLILILISKTNTAQRFIQQLDNMFNDDNTDDYW